MIPFTDNDQEFIATKLLVSTILVSTISSIFFLNNYQSLEEMLPKLPQVVCQFLKILFLLAVLCPYRQFAALLYTARNCFYLERVSRK